MIHFALPDFFFNKDIINYFSFLDIKYFKRDDISFYCATGNFSYNYWNGGFNNNVGETTMYTSIIEDINNINLPLRFNCSNIYLQEVDFDNVYNNLILSLGENASNSIAISNLDLLKYLKTHYPNYKYVFSKEANLIYKFTPEIINTILDNEDFLYLQIPEEYGANMEFLKEIKDKKRIEVPINYICSKQCSRYNNCLRHEHEAQYNFSGYNNFFHCANTNGLNSIIIPFEKIAEYEKIGINHFYINPSIINGVEKNLLFLITYFIKEEYQVEVLDNFCWGQ